MLSNAFLHVDLRQGQIQDLYGEGGGIQRDKRVINILQLEIEFLGWLRVTSYSYKTYST